MKNTVKWILLAVVLVAVIAAAALLYNKLGSEFSGSNLSSTQESVSQEPESSEPEQEESSESREKEYMPAPDFTAYDAEGNEVKLSDYKGKPVVLNFWATWCYYCMQEMPDFDKAAKAYPDVQFLMVNATDGVQETFDSAKAFVDKNDFSFDVVYDTQLNAVYTYQVSSFPITIFIDAEGRLVAHGSGMLSYDIIVSGIDMITE